MPGEIRAKGKSDRLFLLCAASPHQILFVDFSVIALSTFLHGPILDITRPKPAPSAVSQRKTGFFVLDEDDGGAILDAIPALLTIRTTSTSPSQSMLGRFVSFGSDSSSGSPSRHPCPVCRQ